MVYQSVDHARREGVGTSTDPTFLEFSDVGRQTHDATEAAYVKGLTPADHLIQWKGTRPILRQDNLSGNEAAMNQQLAQFKIATSPDSHVSFLT